MTSENTFLTHPLDRPSSRHPWGEETIVLHVAGESYRFEGLHTSQAHSIRERHGWREVSSTEFSDSQPFSTFFRAAPDRFTPLSEIDWSTIIDLDYAPGQICASSYRWHCRIDWDRRTAPHNPVQGALWTTFTDGVPFHDLFENYFRLLVAYRLLSRGGLLVHSSAIADTSGAFLFPGASGAGKSTLSRLALDDGLEILSDDSNALLPGDEGPSLFGLPFGGELRDRHQPTNKFRALGLMSLAHGPRHQTESRSKSSAVGLLMACAPFVNGDPYRRDQVFQTAESLLGKLPTGCLTFARHPGIWPHLEAFRQDRPVVPGTSAQGAATVPAATVPGTHLEALGKVAP